MVINKNIVISHNVVWLKNSSEGIMKKYFNTSLLLATWLVTLPVWAMATSPDTLVDNTAQEVLAIVRQDKDLRAGNTTKILDLVEAKILPHFDFTRMTRLAMGKNWSKATPEQQQVLVKEFRTLLVRTYSNALSSYSEHTITVEPLKEKAGETDTTVKTKVINQGQQPIPIDYSMEKTGDDWKVYDVIAEDISLVNNFRSQFNRVISSSSYEELVRRLKEKQVDVISVKN